MRKIVFGWSCSADCRLHGFHDAQLVENFVTNEELDQLALELAVEEAARYGHYTWGCVGEDDEVEDDHYVDIDGWWEEYVPEKHDMKKPGGGKWFND